MLLSVIFVVLILGGGVVSRAGSTNAPGLNREEVFMNPGTAIEVKAGQMFSLRLLSNPTTGYGWAMTEAPDPVRVAWTTNVFEPPEQELPGSGGHEVWSFQALRPGTTRMTLTYARSWEKHTNETHSNRYTIVVKP